MDSVFNLLRPRGYFTQHQVSTGILHFVLTMYLCILYVFQNEQRLLPYTILIYWYFSRN